ncbi:MAG: ABC transporter permease [Hyphomicrobiaceae bacterium]
MVFTLALRNLIHDRMRFAVTLVGIVFSIVLVAVQLGLYLGSERIILSMLDHSDADLWVVATGSQSFDDSSFLPGREKYAALSLNGVASVKELVVSFAQWTRPNDGGKTAIVMVGTSLNGAALRPWNVVAGDVGELSLSDAVAVDRFYLDALGVEKVGDTAQIEVRKARVVALTDRIRSFTTLPYVFTSKNQARSFIGLPDDRATFVLIKLKPGADPAAVQTALAAKLEHVEVITHDEFRTRSLDHWLFATGAGAALIAGAILGVIVGMVIVAQTLYSSANDHINEFATLRAIGSSAAYIHKVIIWQAVLSAVIGFVIAILIDLAIVSLSDGTALLVVMTPTLAASLFALTVVMCVISALSAIVKVTRIDPAMVFNR